MPPSPTRRRAYPAGRPGARACSVLHPLLGALALGPLLLLAAAPVAAQEAVHHQTPSFDDGVAGRDADGVRNGTVVWAPGPVRVIEKYSLEFGPQEFGGYYRLVVQPGVVVKVGTRIVVENGRVTRWEPNSFGGVGLVGGVSHITGATITDITDDSVGGDTNGDGAASQPPANQAVNYVLGFSHRPGSALVGSTIKYCTRLGRIPTMPITGNHFVAFGGINHDGSFPDGGNSPVVLDARPTISGNTFEFAAGFGGRELDLRGMSAVVENNTLTKASAAFVIGPRLEYGLRDTERRGPLTGTTVIRGNRVEAVYGLLVAAPRTAQDSLFAGTGFRAEVTDNTFTGYNVLSTPPGGPGAQAVEVHLEARVVVRGNTFTNFHTALLPRYNDRTAVAYPVLNENRFTGPYSPTSSPFALPERLWRAGVLLDVKNNFWGDPSGPRDPSGADGLANPRGRGYAYGDGFDYVPFVGGTIPPPRDAVSAAVTSSPAAPLVTGATVTFTATATYVLRSAQAGRLFALVRDADGNLLNPTDAGTPAVGTGTATLPAVAVEVPDDTPFLTVEVALAPDGEGETVRSGRVPFAVDRPSSGFDLVSAVEVPARRFPQPTAGARLRVEVTLRYTLATSSPTANGRFDVRISERIAGTKTVLTDFPLVSFDVPPGQNRPVTQLVEVDLPLRDVLREPPRRVVHAAVILRDDAGRQLERQAAELPIGNPNVVDLRDAIPSRDDGSGIAVPVGRSFLLTGEVPLLSYGFSFQRVNPTGGPWGLFIGPIRLLDDAGRTLATLERSAPLVADVPVSAERVLARRAVTFADQLPAGLPADARRLRTLLRLVAGGLTVAVDSVDVAVREASTLAAVRAVPPGPSTQSFAPVRAVLAVTANARAATLTAEEFDRPFRPGKTAGPTVDVAYAFVPTRRYWALYGDAQEAGLAAAVTFTFDPATDFPDDPAFRADSLVVAGLNPLSGALDPLPTTLDRAASTARAAYVPFYDTYVLAARATVHTPVVAADEARPVAFGLDAPTPNPSGGAVMVRFRLASSAPVVLAVFDLLGRRVRTLVAGELPAGTHAARWDGTGEAGGAVGSGVYFVRLVAGRSVATRTAVRVGF